LVGLPSSSRQILSPSGQQPCLRLQGSGETPDLKDLIASRAAMQTISQARFYPILRATLGAFLLAAAAFKFMAAFVEYSFPDPGLTDQFFHFILAGLECVLGVLLIAGVVEVGTWLMALAFFVASVCTNIYWVAIGKASCGCFGSIPVSPVLMGGFSVLVLCVLLLVRPRPFARLPDACRTGVLRQLPKAALSGICILLAGTPFVLGSATVLGPSLFDDRVITAQSAVVDAGEGPGESFKIITVQLTNHSPERVLVCGGTHECGCVVTYRLPITIAPRGSVEIPVRVFFVAKPGRFTNEMTFFTDSPASPELRIKYSGLVSERSPE
jgi:hypothetical protein